MSNMEDLAYHTIHLAKKNNCSITNLKLQQVLYLIIREAKKFILDKFEYYKKFKTYPKIKYPFEEI